MYEFFLILTAVVVVIAVSILAWGLYLPATQNVTVEKMIHAPVEKVWHVMTDWAQQIRWRSDLKNVEVLDESNFIEHPQKGPKIHFQVTEIRPPYVLNLRMHGIFIGEYRAILEAQADGVTKITACEQVTQTSIVKRVMMKLFFNLERFARSYLNNLANYAEK